MVLGFLTKLPLHTQCDMCMLKAHRSFQWPATLMWPTWLLPTTYCFGLGAP